MSEDKKYDSKIIDNFDDIIDLNDSSLSETDTKSSLDTIYINIPTQHADWNTITIDTDFSQYLTDFQEQSEWIEILKFAKSNPSLKEAMDKVKVLYYLSKES